MGLKTGGKRLQRGPPWVGGTEPYLPSKSVCPCWSAEAGPPPRTRQPEGSPAAGGLSSKWGPETR